ncbi:GNAT family N-acetyltransferase [Stygiolobus caldivivus]|uniref:N-acetyltransferase n=1 Tax=Stygiolobus caldivivus TaxID=2824673 RepID=A0A8D5U4C5_9CREN|nr:GNAT family N-acetyltransferase [Stygiolobus caldivivus]BCU69033.1 N-acetyltransferase [Stygiolobus caldivivus]
MGIEDLISKSLSSYDTYYALKNINSSKILTIKIKGNPVGFAELKKKKDIGGIFYVGVLPEYRGKGIGKTLVKKAEDYFKSKGVSLVVASTKSTNLSAIDMFKALDYKFMKKREVKHEIIMLLDATEDDLIVCKEIEKGSSCKEIKKN